MKPVLIILSYAIVAYAGSLAGGIAIVKYYEKAGIEFPREEETHDNH